MQTQWALRPTPNIRFIFIEWHLLFCYLWLQHHMVNFTLCLINCTLDSAFMCFPSSAVPRADDPVVLRWAVSGVQAVQSHRLWEEPHGAGLPVCLAVALCLLLPDSFETYSFVLWQTLFHPEKGESPQSKGKCLYLRYNTLHLLGNLRALWRGWEVLSSSFYNRVNWGTERFWYSPTDTEWIAATRCWAPPWSWGCSAPCRMESRRIWKVFQKAVCTGYIS